MSNEAGNVASSDETTGNEDDFPREEAARLVQASLRPSVFLIITDQGLREYSVRHPNSVPLVDTDMYGDAEYGFYDILRVLNHHILPHGGVICVPPPDHILCTRCRVGLRAHRTTDDQELCYSCATAFTQMTGVRTVEIENESLGSGNV